MVAFPDSEVEPTFINDTGLTSKDSNKNSDDGLANDIRRIRDQAFTTPRATMPNGNDSYALKFDGIDKINDKKLSVDIHPEPVFVKKVAGKKRRGIKRDRDRAHACTLQARDYVYAIESWIPGKKCLCRDISEER